MKLSSAVILLASATIIWGGTAPIMKFTLQEVPIFTLAFIRMFFAATILGSIIFTDLKIKKEDLPNIFLAALTGVTFNIALFFIGLKLAPAINAALIVACSPVLTLGISHFFLKESIGKRLALGALIALVGVIFIVGMPDGSTHFLVILGNILLFASALSWVFYEIVSKKLMAKYSPAVITFYTMAIGALTFFPFAVYENLTKPTWYYNVSLGGFLGILYGVFLASLFGYWAWQKGLSKMPAGQASFFFYIDPISGAVLSIILLGEKLTLGLIVGGTLITIGVILAEAKRKAHPLFKPRQLPPAPENVKISPTYQVTS